VKEIKKSLVDLSKQNGALYLYKTENTEFVDHVPIALLPYNVNINAQLRLKKVSIRSCNKFNRHGENYSQPSVMTSL
jgi:hypothetical protein